MAFTWFGRVLGSLVPQFRTSAVVVPDPATAKKQPQVSNSQEAVVVDSEGVAVTGDAETDGSVAGGYPDTDDYIAPGAPRKRPLRPPPRAQFSPTPVASEWRNVRRRVGKDAWVRESALWNSLPVEVVEREILPKLAPEALFRLRAVCRRWDVLLWDVYTQQHCPARFFLDFGPKLGGALHDPLRDQWQPLPLEWVQSKVKCAKDVAQVRAAGGGFLFYWSAAMDRGNQGTPPNCLSVCRPSTSEWKDLPLPNNRDRFRYDVVKLIAGTQDSYTVVLAKVDGRNTEVYESSTQCWRMACPLPQTTIAGHDLRGYGWQRSTGPCCNGFLYCMFWCRIACNERPRGAAFGALRGGMGLFSYVIMSFDIERGLWNEILIPEKVGSGLILPFLVECSGHVLMAGIYKSKRLSGNHTECRDKLRIWKLKATGPRVESWTEEGQMPEPIFQEMFTNGRARNGQFRLLVPWMIHCVGVNHFVYVFSWRKNKIAIYDLTKKAWRRFPEWPVLPQFRAASEVTYSFAPGMSE